MRCIPLSRKSQSRAGKEESVRNPNHIEGLQISIDNAATRQSKLDRWPWNIFTSPQTTMAEQKKQEKDFTPEVDAIIPPTTTLAQVVLYIL